MLQRDAGFFDYFAGVIADGIGEFDVIGLPGQRREAHVDLGRQTGVNTAAFVIFAFQAERIEDLHFVMIDLVEAAVAAPLAAGVGAEGEHEFDVGECSC